MEMIPEDKGVRSRRPFTSIWIWLIVFNFCSILENPYEEKNVIAPESYSYISYASKQQSNILWLISVHQCNGKTGISQCEKEKTSLFVFQTSSENFTEKNIKSHNSVYIVISQTFQNISSKQRCLNNLKVNLSENISYGKICSRKFASRFCCNNLGMAPISFLAVFIAAYVLLSYKKSYFSTHDIKEQEKSSYDFVFKLWCKQRLKIDVHHFSLKKYVNGIDKKIDKNSKHMVYEWARLESFQTFPKQCPISTLRLAQTGFYSTGKGVEVICFCCGLKNEHWTENETVSELHKRLSPHCKFIIGEDTENVPIHEVNEVNRNDTEGACGGPNDGPENGRNPNQEQNEKSGKQTNDSMCCNKETEQTSHKITHQLNQHHSVPENGNVHRTCEYDITEEIQYFPGIPNEQPKRPEYAIRNERLLSFSAWSFNNIVKPEALAEAGFVFTEMQDLVRCFFCGGGMKNWAYGDSPWIEHARWFPACAYLKQCKGEDFVNLCQMSSMTFPTQNNFQLRDLDSHRTTIVEDQEIVDLNSIAAKRVFKMGYSQTQIEDAIRHTRLVVGQSGVLKAQTLLEYLLDNCHINSDVTSPHTSTAEDEQNNARSTGEDIPSSSESNTSNNTNGNTAVEAEDMEERQSLKEENRLLKEQMMCKVCMDKDANTVFLPCGHLVACDDCAKVLRKCAVCRKIIQGTVRAYPA